MLPGALLMLHEVPLNSLYYLLKVSYPNVKHPERYLEKHKIDWEILKSKKLHYTLYGDWTVRILCNKTTKKLAFTVDGTDFKDPGNIFADIVNQLSKDVCIIDDVKAFLREYEHDHHVKISYGFAHSAGGLIMTQVIKDKHFKHVFGITYNSQRCQAYDHVVNLTSRNDPVSQFTSANFRTYHVPGAHDHTLKGLKTSRIIDYIHFIPPYKKATCMIVNGQLVKFRPGEKEKFVPQTLNLEVFKSEQNNKALADYNKISGEIDTLLTPIEEKFVKLFNEVLDDRNLDTEQVEQLFANFFKEHEAVIKTIEDMSRDIKNCLQILKNVQLPDFSYRLKYLNELGYYAFNYSKVTGYYDIAEQSLKNYKQTGSESDRRDVERILKNLKNELPSEKFYKDLNSCAKLSPINLNLPNFDSDFEMLEMQFKDSELSHRANLAETEAKRQALILEREQNKIKAQAGYKLLEKEINSLLLGLEEKFGKQFYECLNNPDLDPNAFYEKQEKEIKSLYENSAEAGRILSVYSNSISFDGLPDITIRMEYMQMLTAFAQFNRENRILMTQISDQMHAFRITSNETDRLSVQDLIDSFQTIPRELYLFIESHRDETPLDVKIPSIADFEADRLLLHFQFKNAELKYYSELADEKLAGGNVESYQKVVAEIEKVNSQLAEIGIKIQENPAADPFVKWSMKPLIDQVEDVKHLQKSLATQDSFLKDQWEDYCRKLSTVVNNLWNYHLFDGCLFHVNEFFALSRKNSTFSLATANEMGAVFLNLCRLKKVQPTSIVLEYFKKQNAFLNTSEDENRQREKNESLYLEGDLVSISDRPFDKEAIALYEKCDARQKETGMAYPAVSKAASFLPMSHPKWTKLIADAHYQRFNFAENEACLQRLFETEKKMKELKPAGPHSAEDQGLVAEVESVFTYAHATAYCSSYDKYRMYQGALELIHHGTSFFETTASKVCNHGLDILLDHAVLPRWLPHCIKTLFRAELITHLKDSVSTADLISCAAKVTQKVNLLLCKFTPRLAKRIKVLTDAVDEYRHALSVSSTKRQFENFAFKIIDKKLDVADILVGLPLMIFNNRSHLRLQDNFKEKSKPVILEVLDSKLFQSALAILGTVQSSIDLISRALEHVVPVSKEEKNKEIINVICFISMTLLFHDQYNRFKIKSLLSGQEKRNKITVNEELKGLEEVYPLALTKLRPLKHMTNLITIEMMLLFVTLASLSPIFQFQRTS